MSLESLRKYVEHRLTSQLALTHPAVKIKYENVKFNQPSGSLFVAVYVIDGDSFPANLGDKFTERHVGIIQIDVMTPEGSGTSNRNKLSDRISEIFRIKQAVLDDGSSVTFRSPRTTPLGNEGLFDRVAITFPYYRDEKYIRQ